MLKNTLSEADFMTMLDRHERWFEALQIDPGMSQEGKFELTEHEFSNVTIRGRNLTGCVLVRCRFRNVRFEECILDTCGIFASVVRFPTCGFHGSDLCGCRFFGSQLHTRGHV